jgi:hypothetical protein
MAFHQQPSGVITHLSLTLSAPMALEKVAWYETTTFQVRLAIFILATLALALIWPIGALLQGGKRRWPSRRATLLAGSVAGMDLIFLAGLALVELGILSRGFNRLPLLFLASLILPVISTILTIPLVIVTVQACRARHWSFWSLTHYSLVTLGAVTFIWFVDYWNLLGFRL